ncbi:MAG: non-homologous end-joining DNA ligase, partial [Clostridia bacterium]
MAEKLEKYNKKRDFNRTIEPKGIQSDKKSNKKLKFVVQHHWARREHYDLRLEWEGTLLSWAVPKGPSYNPEDKRLAVKVEDHPLEYRHFEGTIPKGEYGGGTVMLWDEGYWEYQYDVAEGLNKGSLKFTLYGKRLEGNWALVRLKSKDEKDNWLLIKEKDSYAKDHEGIFNFTQGVRSGLTKDEIEKGSNKDEIENGGSSVAAAEGNSFGDTKNKPTAPKKSKAASNTKSKPANNNKNKVSKNPFSEAEAQPALLVSQPPEGEGWIFEPKYDGYRILSFIENNTARLVTRNGNDFTPQFNVLAEELAAHAEGRAVVLDGEVVIADDSGKTDFQALQNYMKNPQGEQLTFAIFDILALDGEDLRGLPLSERKKVLESFMQDAPPNLYFSKELKGSGKQNFLSVCQLKLEGIIGKKLNSVYSGKRNGDWVKVKCANAQEFVVGGYTQTAKKTEGLSALLLGYYEGKELIFAGRAGTGFSEKQRRELAKQFEPIIIKNSPFSILPKIKIDEKVFWLQPQIVAEVQFAGWTDGNVLRQPSFKGIRADKNPLAVVREEEKKVMDNKKKTTTAKPKSSKSIKPKTTSTIELKTASTTDKTVKGIKVSSPDKVVFTNPSITKLDIVRYYGEVSERLLKYAG